jgi:hypothetical protein
MNVQVESTTRSASPSRTVRRIAISAILSGLVFLVLWLTAFSLVTSLLIGSSFCAVVIVASAMSDLVEVVLDAIATVVFGVLAAIAALVAAVFSLLGS